MRRLIADFERATGSLDDRLVAAFAKVALAARQALRRRAAGEGLSAIQAQILVFLEREGPMEVGALARRIALTAPTVSDSIAALERRSLLRRLPHPEDRRRVRVRPTTRGARLARSLALWPEYLGGCIEALSEEEKRTLFRLLTRMILVFIEEGVVQEARMCVTCAYFRPHAHRDPRRPHHCALVDRPLGPATLRIDCPDHEVGRTAKTALRRLDRWMGRAA